MLHSVVPRANASTVYFFQDCPVGSSVCIKMRCQQLGSKYSIICCVVLCLHTLISNSVADEYVGTTFNGRRAYSGRVIFKDGFSDQYNFGLNWQHTVKIGDTPDYEFCVYSSDPANSYIRNNNLVIKPTMPPDSFIRSGTLRLNDCTGQQGTAECEQQARSYLILPPVKSARLNTLGSFTFRYGIVEVIAKMPRGDWLVPELWLEPKENKYGPKYKSGRIKIAMARGNENLNLDSNDLSSKKVENVILVGTSEYNVKSKITRAHNPSGWHSDFHNYTVVWKHDQISFYVDGDYKSGVLEYPGTKLTDYLDFNQNERKTWESGTNLAPFDTEFYISLGLSVGGYREFPDNYVSSGRPKPWRHDEPKRILKFWQDRGNWQSTWNGDDAALKIRMVKVTAV